MLADIAPVNQRWCKKGRVRAHVEYLRRPLLADPGVRTAFERVGRLVPVDPIMLSRTEAGYAPLAD